MGNSCNHGKEPLDLKLLLLRLCRQAHIIVFVTLFSTILFGGGYYLKNVALVQKQYAAMSLYQVEYRMDPISHLEYTYINGETWKRWMITEEFLDILYGRLDGTEDAGIARDVMKTYLSAELLTDLRMPDTIVMTPDAALTLRLAAAVEESMVEFAGHQKGIDNIRVVDPAVDTRVYNTSRPLNACILSALLGLLFVTAVLALRELGSDSLWLPAQITARFGVKALAPAGRDSLGADLRYLLREKRNIGVMAVAEDVDSSAWVKELCAAAQESLGSQEAEGHEWIALPDPEICPEVCTILSGLDGLVLVISAGNHAGGRLEGVLAQLALYDRVPDAVLLTNRDELLLRCYYGKETLLKLWKKRDIRAGGKA